MTVELALLRSARPEIDPSPAALAQRLERLERGAPRPRPPSSRPPRPPRRRRSRRPPATADREPREPAPETADGRGAGAASPRSPRGPSPPPRRSATRAEEVAGEAAASVGAAAQAATEALDLDRVAGLWPAVLDHMRQSGAGLLAAAIGDARPVAVDPDRSVVELGFPPSAAFNRRKAEVKENRDRVVEAIALGRRGDAAPGLRDARRRAAETPPTPRGATPSCPARTTCSSASSASSTPRS